MCMLEYTRKVGRLEKGYIERRRRDGSATGSGTEGTSRFGNSPEDGYRTVG